MLHWPSFIYICKYGRPTKARGWVFSHDHLFVVSRRRQNFDFGQAGEKVSGHFTSLHVPQALHLSKQLKTQVILQSGIFCVFSFIYIQSVTLHTKVTLPVLLHWCRPVKTERFFVVRVLLRSWRGRTVAHWSSLHCLASLRWFTFLELVNFFSAFCRYRNTECLLCLEVLISEQLPAFKR